MNTRIVSVTLAALSIAFSTMPSAQACVTKSGKDCSASVAHKAVYSKKLIKLAPAGGVGSTTHSQGFDQLGSPTFSAAPAPQPGQQQNFGTNPDGWFYLMPSSQDSGGFAPKPMPHQIMQIISRNAERTGQNGGLIKADGSLTSYAVSVGWVRTGAPVPVAVSQQAPPTSQAQQPATPQYQPPVPQQVQPSTPQIAVPLPNGIRAPNLLPGHAAAGPKRSHPEQLVDVYHPTKAGLYRYEDAHKIGDPSFHLVVIGIKEPE